MANVQIAINEVAYSKMLQYLDNLISIEKKGDCMDVHFITEDFWLQNTAVIENVEYRNGEWNIFLVFADHLLPLKFIKRKIVQYSSHKKAIFNAKYMRRQAAKDQRGTIVVDVNMFEANFN